MQQNVFNFDFSFDFESKKESDLESHLIDCCGHELFRKDLERVRSSFARFREIFESRRLKIVTIAGTNGKGETAHTLSYLLKESGKAHALWTSPHILSLRERISVNGQMISYEVLQDLFRAVDQEVPIGALSYYEYFFYAFCKQIEFDPKIEIIILEVGMGGRLDAVNVFDADVVAITSISLDHTAFLGPTESDILREKMGVMRPGKPVFTALESDELRWQVQERSLELNSPCFDLFEHQLITPQFSYDIRNQMMARVLFEALTSPHPQRPRLIDQAFPVPCLQPFKGRRERFQTGAVHWVFIGAHNPDGVVKMMDWVNSFVGRDQLDDRPSLFLDRNEIWLAFSQRPIEDIRSMLQTIQSRWLLKQTPLVLTTFDHPKALSLDLLSQLSEGDREKWYSEASPLREVRLDSDLPRMIQQVISENEPLTILVAGSYYFIGEVQKIILKTTLG